MIFNKQAYDQLKALTFRPEYPGFRPDVLEAPNRDGRIDHGKLYSHVALRYLRGHDHGPLFDAFVVSLQLARQVATAAGVTGIYQPDAETSALRVLWYPAGAGSCGHTDSDLLTLNLYRNEREPLYTESQTFWHWGDLAGVLGLGKPCRHGVRAAAYPQESIVFAANPRADAVLPDGRTVGEWLKENVGKQRVKAGAP